MTTVASRRRPARAYEHAAIEAARTVQGRGQALGKELGLPESFIGRHASRPRPRHPLSGGITREAEILREADAIISTIRKAGLYDAIWQAFAVLLPVQTVGVMGDGRTYESFALRAVTSVDGMTADFTTTRWHSWVPPPRIINEVRGINRVVYDVTSSRQAQSSGMI